MSDDIFGTQQRTQTSVTQLDPTVQPFVGYGLEEAKRLYQNFTPQYFPGQTFVGPSEATQAALVAQRNRAIQGSPATRQAQQTASRLTGAVNPAGAVYQNILSGANAPSPTTGFYTGLMGGGMANPAIQQYQSLYGAAANDPSRPFYQSLSSGAFVNPAMEATRATASGQYLSGNPFFQGAFQPAAQAATQQFNQAIQDVNSRTSMAGRYGSGAMGQLQDRAAMQLANALTNTAGNLAYQNYAAERGMQEAGIGRLGSLGQQDLMNRLTGAQQLTAGQQQQIANQLAATSGLSGAFSGDVANRLAAAGQLDAATQQRIANQLAAAGGISNVAAGDLNRQLQAAESAGTLARQDYLDIAQLAAAGQAQEAYQAQALQDQINRFNFAQNLPQQQLSNFLSAAYGAPAGTQTRTPVYSSPLLSGLGGAALGSQLGFGPAGAIFGGLAGLLGA